MIKKPLQKVIDDYLSKVEQGVSLFKKQLGDKHPLQAWGNKDIPQRGKLSDAIEYEFHGIGCALIFSDCEVDFDFGPDDRVDGFDLWRLTQYLLSCPNKYPDYSADKIKKDFENALEHKAITKLTHPYCNLYFYS